MKKLLILTVVLASSMLNAQSFTIDSGAQWNIYMNAFNVADDSFAGFGFSDGTTAFAGFGNIAQAFFTADTLNLGPNIKHYDKEFLNPAWVDQVTKEAIFYTEMNVYNEFDSTAGNVINFDWLTLTNDVLGLTGTTTYGVDASYDVQAFIKVLDPGNGWATVDSIFVPLAVGTQGLSLVVPATIGVPKAQIGFFVKGDLLTVSDPLGANYSTVTAVPEPSTFALFGGIAALGIVLYRRRKRA